MSRLVSPAEAAAYAGVHRHTIDRWISSGKITGYKLGEWLVRVDLDEIDTLYKPIPTVRAG
jgi:excisionase family DNA binding protein